MAELKRRFPRAAEVARFVGPTFRRQTGGRWSRVRTAADFRELARRRTPRAVFDYVEGAAELELSRDRAVAAFKRVVFKPHVLRDVAAVDTTTTILGREVELPIVFGPTGFTRMMHAAGEPAVARAAGRAGIPYVLSTLGTTSIEQLAAAAPTTNRWFQLYVSKDRGRSGELIARAADAGYTTLVLTVDVPVAGARHRDVYNGLTFPPSLTGRTLLGMVSKPRWLLDVLTTEPLAFESLGAAEDVMGLINTVFDPSVTVADIDWLRTNWAGAIVVKGIQRVDDALEVVSAGADGVPSPTTAGANSTALSLRSTCSRPWSTRSAKRPRSTWTAASAPAPTLPLRLRSAPEPPSLGGPTCTRSWPAAATASTISPRSSATTTPVR